MVMARSVAGILDWLMVILSLMMLADPECVPAVIGAAFSMRCSALEIESDAKLLSRLFPVLPIDNDLL